jgi:pyridoxal phosphate enzyme (YggS family)
MIAENVKNIRDRIVSACVRAGRHPDEVTLVAVAKTFGAGMVGEVRNAGVVDIGENYVQDLRRKREELNDERIRWHFVGHLQRNKVKELTSWIHLIHSIDSKRLAEEISHQAAKAGRTVDILVEVNTSGEQTKFGVAPEETPTLVRELKDLPYVHVAGLMTIGPFLPNPEDSRPAFRALRQLRDHLQDNGIEIPHLSMGMSNDFEVAIEEGATLVRVGTAIFGKRVKPDHN